MNKNIRQKFILSAALMIAATASAFAQGNGIAGINEATSMVSSYFDPGTKLIYAIGAVVGLIGGVKVYGKFSSGGSSGRISMNIPFVSFSVSGILSSISIPSIPMSSNILLTRSTASVVVVSVNFFHFISISPDSNKVFSYSFPAFLFMLRQ